MYKNFNLTRVAAFVAMTSLVACGTATNTTPGANTGGSGGGNPPTPNVNAPQVNAGDDKSALTGSFVVLEGFATDDGFIETYQWEQVSNGAPAVQLSGANETNASFVVPELFTAADFLFNLTVTDNEGASGTDAIKVTGRPAPGAIVSEVQGNTMASGSIAEFSVRLLNAPSADVAIPVYSGMPADGTPNVDELVFTPENWATPQVVQVVGARDGGSASGNGYPIVLASANSADPFYHLFNPEDAQILDLTLEVRGVSSSTFLPEQEGAATADIFYNGNGTLTYSLANAPEGMAIDLNSGVITWKPAAHFEGDTYMVTVKVNDGELFEERVISISVEDPKPLASEVSGNAIVVTDETSSLKGVVFGAPPSQQKSAPDFSSLELETMALTNLASVPAKVIPVTDAFFVRDRFESPIAIEITASDLPEGYRLRDLNVYGLATSEDVDGAFWSPVGVDVEYSGTTLAPVATVTLTHLEGVYFFGVSKVGFTNGGTASANQSKAALASSVTCTPTGSSPDDEEGDEYMRQVCSIDGVPDLEVTVFGYGRSENATQWGGVAIESMITWLADSKEKLNLLSMNSDPEFRVRLYEEAPQNGQITLGYVTTMDNRRVLHLNNHQAVTASMAKATAAHEYFHHAQSRTTADGTENLIDHHGYNKWAIEGTATWFEDLVFDDLDGYRGVGNSRFLEYGLTSGENGLEGYRRFAFFKMLESACSNFDVAALFSVTSADLSGIEKLASSIQNAGCYFGDQFGPSESSKLASALSLYSYYTLLRNDISLLDSNENPFSFIGTNYRFSPALPSTTNDSNSGASHELRGPSQLPATGAVSFRVPAVAGQLEEGAVAELVIESDREVLVSIVSESSDFQSTGYLGEHSHDWFSTAEQSSYQYNANGSVPELFVTLINPALSGDANIDVSFRIRQGFDASAIISAPSDGDSVDNRVVSIAGSIPAEARDDVDRVVVTANGIESTSPLNEDGSFAVDVVVFLGDNIIKAQGFNGNTPTTDEDVISLVGENAGIDGRNALIPSGAVFVLRWDADQSDVDIYSEDQNADTIWFGSRRVDGGYLDVDNTIGYGPEVVSYQADHPVLVDGLFNIDVHYYSGLTTPKFFIDVILNETKGVNRRAFRFDSLGALLESNPTESNPDGEGQSRHNDVLNIDCNSQGLCGLSRVDNTVVRNSGSSSQEQQSRVSLNQSKSATTSTGFSSAKARCEFEQELAEQKGQGSFDACADDGRKIAF